MRTVKVNLTNSILSLKPNAKVTIKIFNIEITLGTTTNINVTYNSSKELSFLIYSSNSTTPHKGRTTKLVTNKIWKCNLPGKIEEKNIDFKLMIKYEYNGYYYDCDDYINIYYDNQVQAKVIKNGTQDSKQELLSKDENIIESRDLLKMTQSDEIIDIANRIDQVENNLTDYKFLLKLNDNDLINIKALNEESLKSLTSQENQSLTESFLSLKKKVKDYSSFLENKDINKHIQNIDKLIKNVDIIEHNIIKVHKRIIENSKAIDDIECLSPDPRQHFKFLAKKFFEHLHQEKTNTQIKNNQYKEILNFFGSQQINEVLTNLLPVSKDDKLSEDEKWIGKQCILIRDGINLLEMQSLNIPEEYSLDSTITFIESIDLEKLKNESSDIAIKSFKKIRAANESDKRIKNDCYIPTPYELFHIKMYQRFKDIDNIYIENKKKFEKNPEDNLKTVINDFVTNQLLPFIEKNMDNIIEYHQTKIDKSCRREKQNLEKIKNVLLDKATITKIEPRTGKDKFNPEMHLQMREDQNTKVPDMIVLEIIRDGYYCNATQTVIRKAGVVVNYNFSG